MEGKNMPTYEDLLAENARLKSDLIKAAQRVERFDKFTTWNEIGKKIPKGFGSIIDNSPLISVNCWITNGDKGCLAFYSFMRGVWVEVADDYILDFTPTHFVEQYIPSIKEIKHNEQNS